MQDNRLKILIAVAEKKSFSKAAEELFLTQPAVSVQIHNLEDHYGTRLFDRKEKEVVLTPAGEILYKYAKQIINLHIEAENEISELTGLVRGKMVLGASTTAGEYLLPKIIGKFKEEHPNIEILLKIGNTRRVVRKIAANTLDLGVIEGPFKNTKIIEEKLANDELVVICSNQHPWAGKDSISLEELVSSKLILREPGSGTREVIEEFFKKAGVPLNRLQIMMELGSSEAIKAAVEANLGIGIMSEWALIKEYHLKNLKILRIDDLKMTRNFSFIYHKDSFRTQAVIEFMKFAKTAVENYLGYPKNK